MSRRTLALYLRDDLPLLGALAAVMVLSFGLSFLLMVAARLFV